MRVIERVLMGWTLPVAIYFVTDTWLIVVISHLVSKVFSLVPLTVVDS
jgi:hypothetical protein